MPWSTCANRPPIKCTITSRVNADSDRLEQDPDQHVREAIALVFSKFRELGTVRQVLLWFRQERIELPANRFTPGGRQKVWKLPVYNTVLKILTNPTYAGAYVFGRTKSLVRIVKGRKKIYKGQKVAQADWSVLLHEHHTGYISWEEYQANLRTIANNAQMQGTMVQRGSAPRSSVAPRVIALWALRPQAAHPLLGDA